MSITPHVDMGECGMQATIRKFQLEEMVACDLTFSYGTPKGKSMPDPISVSFMAVIARAISAHVKKVMESLSRFFWQTCSAKHCIPTPGLQLHDHTTAI